jgi:hypothetical protein
MFRHSEITPVMRFSTTRNDVISTPEVGLDTYNDLADSLAQWLSKWAIWSPPRGPHQVSKEPQQKVNVYLPSLRMKVPDHVYVFGSLLLQ